MTGDLEFARQQQDSHISREVCRAMRALDEDEDYTRSEIAFMFECQVPTVARHADRDCSCGNLPAKHMGEFTAEQCLDAIRVVNDRANYQRISYSGYRRRRDDEMPSVSTIQRLVGSWQEARRQALEGDA